MVRRLEVQNDILYSKFAGKGITLPKLEKNHRATKIYALPTEEEIEECLNRAKRFAINDASQFGMNIDPADIEDCAIQIASSLDLDEEMIDGYDSEDEIENEFENSDFEDVNEGIDSFLSEEDDQQRAFVLVTDHLGNKKHIRKSTFVWQLFEGTKKISSDRLVRVQEKANITVTPRVLNRPSTTNIVYVSNHIKLGDWCFFNVQTATGEMVYIGQLHAFRYANCKLVKDKMYRFDSVDLAEKPILAKQLEVLSTWYLVNDEAVLIPVNLENHFFVSMEKYIGTTNIHPTIDPDTRILSFCKNDFKVIEDSILKLIG